MKFVLASQNPNKLKEMQDILSGCGIEIVLQSDIGLKVEVEETGTTFAENAMLKAKSVMEASGLPAIADDSGLCVDALNGAPGIYTARYGGPGLDDAGRNALLLENMRNIQHRSAHYTCAIACIFPDEDVIVTEACAQGRIALEPRGTGGFAYDPVFFVSEMGKTYAELTPEEKNAVSHRGKALCLFGTKLQEYLDKKGLA